MLNNADLELCARTLGVLGHDQPDEVRLGLACMLRNRIARMKPAAPGSPVIAAACSAVRREALGPEAERMTMPALPGAERRRLRSLLDIAWTDEIPDRTDGATACHRHDASPAWAKKRAPTALLGAFLFFR